MKKTSSAFAVMLGLAVVYAMLTSRIRLVALALTGGWSPAAMEMILLFGVNSALALSVGILAGLRPLARCYAILPAPVLLVTVHRLVAGTAPPLLWMTALYMLALGLLGMELSAAICLLVRLRKPRK